MIRLTTDFRSQQHVSSQSVSNQWMSMILTLKGGSISCRPYSLHNGRLFPSIWSLISHEVSITDERRGVTAVLTYHTGRWFSWLRTYSAVTFPIRTKSQYQFATVASDRHLLGVWPQPGSSWGTSAPQSRSNCLYFSTAHAPVTDALCLRSRSIGHKVIAVADCGEVQQAEGDDVGSDQYKIAPCDVTCVSKLLVVTRSSSVFITCAP